MYCFDNLNNNIKTVVKYRCLYVILLTIINIYCSTIIILKLNDWLIILVLCFNILLTLTSIFDIWKMIYDECCFGNCSPCCLLIDLISNIITSSSSLSYLISYSNYEIKLYDIIISIFYSTILIFVLILFFVVPICIKIYEKLKDVIVKNLI